MSRLPKSVALVAALAATTVSLGACNTAKPAPQMGARTAMLVPGSPSSALASVRGQVAARQGTVVSETANSMVVDFGEQTMPVPVPTDYGLWGSRVSWRETQVRSSAMYHAEACPQGTMVTIFTTPIYWHPDLKQWLPGPFDVPPGFQTLAQVAGAEQKAE
jgi:hypothetical protein